MLRKLKLQAKLKEAKLKLEEFEKTRQQLDENKRELEQALEEANSNEDLNLIEEKIDNLPNDTQEQEQELKEQINKIEEELDKLNKKEIQLKSKPNVNTQERNLKQMNETTFNNVELTQRARLIQRSEVKEFLNNVRGLALNKRGVTNTNLLIPEVMLDLLRDNLNIYSKLRSKVNLKVIKGKARQRIAGTIPEGVWTEATATLNEVAITFNELDLDGYKVGAFIPIANATLEDSDIDLFNEIFNNLGQGLGLALDRAILFGTGIKKPIGIATRLAETTQPSYWETYRNAWTDLHTTNLLKFSATEYAYEGAKWFSTLIEKLGVIKQNYAPLATKFWAMNSKTYNKILAKAVAFDSSATVVSQVKNQMPIIGGEIVILDFIADNDIFGGYGSLYLLGERKETQMAYSTEYKFVEDQTVFKATARYDGQPIFGEGFVGVNIGNNTSPTTTSNFPEDTANP